MKFFKKALTTGLGAVFLTKDKIEEIAQELVKEGTVSREEAEELIDDMLERSKEQSELVRQKIKTEIDNNLDRAGLAKKDEVNQLKNKVENLELKLKHLERKLDDECKGE